MSVSAHITVEELVCLESFQEYCRGTSLPEQLFWEEWAQNHPERAADLEEARRLFQVVSARQGNRLEQLKQLRAGIEQSEAFKTMVAAPAPQLWAETPQTRQKTRHFYMYLGGVAAAVLVLALAYVFLYRPAPTPFAQRTFTPPPSAQTLVQAGPTHRKTVILADGSVVTLRENSSLRYGPDFNQQTREVWLSGEGFFDVRHDQTRPFLVHAQFTDVKVLGTIFNARARPDSDSTEISLLRGSVEVTSVAFPDQTVILKPNQKLISRLTANATPQPPAVKLVPLTKEGTAPQTQETAWARTRLAIDNEPLSGIAQKLEKWYGIEISFSDPEVMNYRYSGVFENENVVRTLEALQLSYPFTFTVEKEKIKISK